MEMHADTVSIKSSAVLWECVSKEALTVQIYLNILLLIYDQKLHSVHLKVS
jgi:hypothetical protein